MPVGAVMGAVGVAGAAASVYGSNKAAKAQKKAAEKGQDTQLQMFETARGDLEPWRNVGQSALYSLADMYGLSHDGKPTGAAQHSGGIPSPSGGDAVRRTMIGGEEYVVIGTPDPNARPRLGGGPRDDGVQLVKASEYDAQQAATAGDEGQASQGAFNESALEAFRNSPDYQVASREAIQAVDRSAAARGNLLSGGQTRRVMEVGADIGSRYFGSYLDRLTQLAGGGQAAAAGQAQGALQTGQGVAGSQLAAGQATAAGWIGGTNAVNQSLGNAANNYAFMHYMNQPSSAYSGTSAV